MDEIQEQEDLEKLFAGMNTLEEITNCLIKIEKEEEDDVHPTTEVDGADFSSVPSDLSERNLPNTAGTEPSTRKENSPFLHVVFDKETQAYFHLLEKTGSSNSGHIFIYKAIRSPDATIARGSEYFSVRLFDNSRFTEQLDIESVISKKVGDHSNILGIEREFIDGDYYGVVFPFMERGSVRTLMTAKHPNGMPEDCALIVLKETLKALSAIHQKYCHHLKLSAGHIYVNNKGALKLGLGATIYEVSEAEPVSPLSSTLPLEMIDEWAAAPEVDTKMVNKKWYKGDIWLFGVLGLELVYGPSGLKFEDKNAFRKMVTKMRDSKGLPKIVKKVSEASSSSTRDHSKNKGKLQSSVEATLKLLVNNKERELSKEFEKMILECFATIPEHRPSADDLLNKKIFKNTKTLKSFHEII